MYVRRKTSPGGAPYYQLVETSRVDGKPRQRVVLHLGQHATTEEALKKWPREINRLRRRGDTRAADALSIKLKMLKAVAPKKFWRVSKELESKEGLHWIRARLEGYDWSQCEGIVVRRRKGNYIWGTDAPPTGLYDRQPKNAKRLLVFHLEKDATYPKTLMIARGRSPQGVLDVQDESEAIVYLLAVGASKYLSKTGLAFEATPDELLEEFRSSRRCPV